MVGNYRVVVKAVRLAALQKQPIGCNIDANNVITIIANGARTHTRVLEIVLKEISRRDYYSVYDFTSGISFTNFDFPLKQKIC